MVVTRLFPLVIALALLPASQLCAKGKPKGKPSHPAAAPEPAVAPASSLPSDRLQTYSDYNLEHLLGPLNGGTLPRAELMRMEIDFKAHLTQATPEEKPMWQAAVNVCLAFDNIVNEREKAVLAMQGGRSPITSGALGATRTVHFNDWRDGLQAQREADEARARQQQAKASDAFVVSSAASSADTAWRQRAQPWRNQIQQLLVAAKQAELPPAPAGPAGTAPAP